VGIGAAYSFITISILLSRRNNTQVLRYPPAKAHCQEGHLDLAFFGGSTTPAVLRAAHERRMIVRAIRGWLRSGMNA
jgi:hypothetical protein